MSVTQFHNLIHPALLVAGNRDFKQIGTAGADTAARSIFPQNETLRMYIGCIQREI